MKQYLVHNAEVVEGMPNDEYHANPAIGSTMLNDFRKSRRLYYGKYIAKTIVREPTPTMEFGSMVHMAILEPELFASRYIPYPEKGPDGEKLDRRYKEHKAFFAEYAAAHAGKTFVKPEDWQRLERVLVAADESPDLFETIRQPGSKTELSVFWTCPKTGLRLKARFDWLGKRGAIDIKTTRDTRPDVFARAAFNLGYHRSKAHYQAGLAMMNRDDELTHLAVMNQEPYTIAAYSLRDPDNLGYNQWCSTLDDLAECYESGDWSDWYARGEVTEIDLPRYAKYEDEYAE